MYFGCFDFRGELGFPSAGDRMYGSIVFSSVFAITERNEVGLYDVPMFMDLFGF